MSVLIDSFNGNQDINSGIYSGSATQRGQTFTNTSSCILNSCKFYLNKQGSPTGNAVAKIYAHTGTYGSTGKPTGSVLATSDNFDVSTLTTSLVLKTFTFSGVNKITLSASTYYCVVVEYTGGNSINFVNICYDNTSTPGASGNMITYSGGWSATSSRDASFYVYADDPVASGWTPRIIMIN